MYPTTDRIRELECLEIKKYIDKHGPERVAEYIDLRIRLHGAITYQARNRLVRAISAMDGGDGGDSKG